MKVAASFLAFDMSKLHEQFSEVNKYSDWLHYDVMDGHFVPNISFGYDVLKDIAKLTNLYLDVHLMLTDPDLYVDKFIEAGAKSITFHIEAMDAKRTHALIEHLKDKGIKVGLSLKPKTDPKDLVPYLDMIDMILVMSVEPGFGGQSFMPNSYEKISFYNEYRKVHNLSYLIEVDGGVSNKNAASLVECGCDVLVSGSYLLKGNIEENFRLIKE